MATEWRPPFLGDLGGGGRREEGEARGASRAFRRVALRFMHDSMEGTAFELHWIVPKTTLKVGYADMRWGDGLRLGIDWRF